ncbi:MAG TPA: hypothetical protein VJN94_07655 [Candidatus Binataceae bacterium]|nr:hypothetical protein [Candidatus Binataceae bacterium]
MAIKPLPDVQLLRPASLRLLKIADAAPNTTTGGAFETSAIQLQDIKVQPGQLSGLRMSNRLEDSTAFSEWREQWAKPGS